MRRWQADCLLGFAGLIWGFGFVAQKDAAAQIGPFTFVACRFLMSALFVLPFVWREGGLRRLTSLGSDSKKIIGLCATFVGAVTFQQVGMATTTVTKASFITGIYIVLVPFAAFILYRHKFSLSVITASLLSFLGIWLLTGANFSHPVSNFNIGDSLILLCAICFALQVPMMGHVVGAVKAPFTLSFVQYGVTALITLMLALCFETIDLHVLAAAWLPITYAGLASGGIAYTLQAVAQQHTPTVDSAIIMSSESLFGAVGGAWLLHERMDFSGYVGCAAILASVILVELIPYLQARYGRA